MHMAQIMKEFCQSAIILGFGYIICSTHLYQEKCWTRVNAIF